jgi:hypothetical protein
VEQLGDLVAAIDDLRSRVRSLEDQLALLQAVATYGPAVDGGSARTAAELWSADGVFEVPPHATWRGREEITGIYDGDSHRDLMSGGVAHVLTAPRVRVEGDVATGWNHALHLRWDAEQDRFWIMRVAANEWRWRRTDEGWRVEHRASRSLDGDPAAWALFTGVADDPGQSAG